MKKYILMLCALIFCCFYAEAQFPRGLKGPAAKNYKPWQKKYQEPSVFVQSVKTSSRYKGTKAKNQKTWLRESKPIVLSTRQAPRLKGPEAKNWKAWSKQDRKEDALARKENKRIRKTASSKLSAKDK